VIHEALEGGGAVAHPEKHDSWFKESSTCFEGGLSLVFFSDSDIVVSLANVEFAE
jgi:hypothetical protein